MPIQSPVYGRCGRIGLIVPANNSVIEPEFWSVLPPGVAAYGTRVMAKGDRVDPPRFSHAFDLQRRRQRAGSRVVVAFDQHHFHVGMPGAPRSERCPDRRSERLPRVQQVTQENQRARLSCVDQERQAREVALRRAARHGYAMRAKRCRLADVNVGDHQHAGGSTEQRSLREEAPKRAREADIQPGWIHCTSAIAKPRARSNSISPFGPK